ncbi:bcl-2-related ovarian killer protein homolog B-like [Phlebotomus argentipes]|uniref:bcl-2-related ovarian killer protein homolog B-like n=1 Tax=Phlebotomus argentipes TaxID=94469 RepID=UPI002892CCB4|nr:bcl-2-related ovarian killer protein homolog B-like [Phlebotomus argentipes]
MSDYHEFSSCAPGEWKKRKKVDYLMVSPQDIIAQGKCLCLQYIRFRLKRSGALNRKVIQRLRTITIDSPATNSVIRDVFPIMNGLGEELERMHPRVYSNVGRQLSRAWGDLPEAETLSVLLAEVAKELFRGGASWARVISFCAVLGGVALDCVRLGRSEALPRLVEVFGHVVEEDLMAWLEAKGGWKGLQAVRATGTECTVMGWLSISVALLSVIYLATCVLDSVRKLIF